MEGHSGLEQPSLLRMERGGCWLVCLKSLWAVSPLRVGRCDSRLPLGPQCLGESGPWALPLGWIDEGGSVLPQMTPKPRRRSPLKHSKMVTKRKMRRGRGRTRSGSSSSCSTLQTGASQVLGWGRGQRAVPVCVAGFLMVGPRSLGRWLYYTNV